MRILVLGGTAEGRELSVHLDNAGYSFVSSLAGRVSAPRLPVGEVRIGGFGGVEGLSEFLRANGISACIDATHPFAVTMSATAVQACDSANVELLRLARPGWRSHPLAQTWTWVRTYADAKAAAEEVGTRPFLTTGRQTLAAFASWADRSVLVRVVQSTTTALPAKWTVIHSRGPYTRTGEEQLMAEHRVDVLLTKDSGGSYTEAKLWAAHDLRIPVVVVGRPVASSNTPSVGSVNAAVEWLRALPAE